MPNSTAISKAADGGIVLVIDGICQSSSLFCVTVTLVYFLLIVTGIILNLFVCHVMVKSKRYIKSISCFMITHLSIVEIVYRVAFTPPLVLLSIPSSDKVSSISCKASYFIASTCRAAIFGSLVVIALDRYRNIVHPLNSLKHSIRPIKLVLSVWVYSVASSAMFLYTAEKVPLSKLPEGRIADRVQNDKTSCDITPDYIGGISITVSMVMTFVVPLATIAIAYTAIFVSLSRRCRSGLVHKASSKSKTKAAKMLVIVVCGFVVCWAPSITMTTIRSYGGLDNTPMDVLVGLSTTSYLLVLCSSLINPIIYAFYSSGFKDDFAKMCVSCRPKRKINHSGSAASRTTSYDTAL